MLNRKVVMGIMLLCAVNFAGCGNKQQSEEEIINNLNKEKIRIETLSSDFSNADKFLQENYNSRNKDIINYTNAVYKKGDKGDEITSIQKNLKRFNYPITINGTFDENTEKFIRDFQFKAGLNGDGVVGQATRNQLKKEPTEKTKYIPPRTDVENMNDAEKFINNTDNYSKTDYFIYVDSNAHMVNIFKGTNKNWKIEKQFECSMGSSSSPTIKGKYEVGDKGLSFGQDKGFMCKYFTQISGGYLFHSVLYDVNGKYVTDGRMGMNISHGCIRLQTENAKWIYDNIPQNTAIYIK